MHSRKVYWSIAQTEASWGREWVGLGSDFCEKQKLGCLFTFLQKPSFCLRESHPCSTLLFARWQKWHLPSLQTGRTQRVTCYTATWYCVGSLVVTQQASDDKLCQCRKGQLQTQVKSSWLTYNPFFLLLKLFSPSANLEIVTNIQSPASTVL